MNFYCASFIYNVKQKTQNFYPLKYGSLSKNSKRHEIEDNVNRL